jgi:F0F1-type ATP synthase epsilon subunit
MEVKILSFSGEEFFSSKVISVTMMTTSGEITILSYHEPLLSIFKPSPMVVVYQDDT